MNELTPTERRAAFRARVLSRNANRTWTRPTWQGCALPPAPPLPVTSDASRQTWNTSTGLDTPTVSYVPVRRPMPVYVDAPRPTPLPSYLTRPSHLGARLTWTPGDTRRQRWTVRAYLDIVNRERVARLDALEMADARYISSRNGGRVERARIAAGLPPTVTGHAPTRDGAWSDDSPRDVINARETRAAERGRGRHRNAPAASKVTGRDAHGDPAILKSLRTVGVATHPDATGADYMTALDIILTRPTLSTYRVLTTAPWGVDVNGAYPGHAAWGEYVPRVAPLDAPILGAVLPVYVDDTPDTPTSDAPTVDAPVSDVVRYGAILGVADPVAAQG